MRVRDPVIAVDVDLTVCAIDTLWVAWLENVTGVRKIDTDFFECSLLDYNLSSYWEDHLNSLGVCGLDFFRGSNIYDFAAPVPNSKEVLSKVTEEYYVNLIFVSAPKGLHYKSKYQWLSRNFKFDGFIGTKEKHFVKHDIMIDDRNEFLNRSDAKYRIKLKTRYTQNEPLSPGVEVYDNWKEIGQRLEDILENWHG